MKVSVIIPVYNAEKFLRRCLDSVIGQSIEKEIICVDDGSTDSSLDILKEYSEKYKYIHILSQRNQYAGIARNNGLSMAKGEYVHFLDADDYIITDIYSAIYKLAKNKDADYIKARNIAFDMTTGRYIENNSYSLKNWDSCFFNRLISLKECPDILLKTSVAPWSAWVRKNYVQENGILFNGLKCVNDRSFYVQAICNTDRIVVFDDYVVAHQVNNCKSLVGIRNINYECLIESYGLVKEIMLKFPDELKKRVMSEELRNVVRVYSGQPERQKMENEGMLRDFFQKFDWKEINREMLLDSHMNDIYQRLKIHLWDIFDMQLCIDNLINLKKYFSEKSNIVIYGAGKVCEILLKYLLSDQLDHISCIVVSNAENNVDNISGIPVREKSKEILDQAQMIIIATLENAHLTIYRTLLSMGNYNIKIVSNKLYENYL